MNSAYRSRMVTETVPHSLEGTDWELQCLPPWFMPSRHMLCCLTANSSELLSGFITAYQLRWDWCKPVGCKAISFWLIHWNSGLTAEKSPQCEMFFRANAWTPYRTQLPEGKLYPSSSIWLLFNMHFSAYLEIHMDLKFVNFTVKSLFVFHSQYKIPVSGDEFFYL